MRICWEVSLPFKVWKDIVCFFVRSCSGAAKSVKCFHSRNKVLGRWALHALFAIQATPKLLLSFLDPSTPLLWKSHDQDNEFLQERIQVSSYAIMQCFRSVERAEQELVGAGRTGSPNRNFL